MSTGADLSINYDNSPWGHRYVIHLKNKDEICLHALTLLQAGLHSCFLNVDYQEEENELLIDLSGCTPLSELTGKEKAYVYRNYQTLFTLFLTDLIRSLDHAMDPGGICYKEDQLFYDRKRKTIVCVYLPLSSRLTGSPFLSGFDESGLDDLLHVAYENNWISTKAMEKLYDSFRKDDESAALKYISDELWKDSRTLSSRIRLLCIIWAALFLIHSFISKKIARRFKGQILAALPGTVFLLFSFVLLIYLLFQIRNTSRDNKVFGEKKILRRKTRNTKILFPSFDTADKKEDHFLDLHPDPVQLIRIDSKDGRDHQKMRLTIWTNTCTVGSDSDCCALSIDHSSLALRHAVFGHDEYGFYIEALQEKKGTYRNRQRIRPNMRSYLEDGDIVGIGDLEFEVHFIHRERENQ